MAGNHTTRRIPHVRLMLIALACAVCWLTLSAWRPGARPVDASPAPDAANRYQASRQAMVDRLQHASRTPLYRWLAAGEGCCPRGTSPLACYGWEELSTLGPIDVPASPLFEPHARQSRTVSRWSPPASRGLPELDVATPLSTSSLLAPDGGDVVWLVRQLGRVDWTRPGWQAVDYQRWQAAWHLARSAWPVAARPAADESRRLASPPGLLSGPRLTQPSDRLAMIPRHPSPAASVPGRGNWHLRINQALRPLFAARMQQALGESPLAEPVSLVEMVGELADEPATADWAEQTLAGLEQLTARRPGTAATIGDLLDRLAHLSRTAETLAAQLDRGDAPGLATRVRRARYALWRRVDVWRAAVAVARPPLDRFTLAGAVSDRASGSASHIATRPLVTIEQLLADIERYESAPSRAAGNRLASELAQLSDAPRLAQQQLADTIAAHYRNANVRVAVTEQLVNRLMPTPEPSVDPIRDRILGTPVSGQATTRSDTTATLLSDPRAWRVGLELSGAAESQTIALERTVRVRTHGVTNFAARQQVVFDGKEFLLGDVVADANSHSRFLTANSDFDILPLVGGIVRSRAAGTFAQRRQRAQDEVAAKTAYRIQQQMDRTVRDALARTEARWQSKVGGPLSAAGVRIEPVELKTTGERLVARLRLAQPDSLTAHTPRPRALADSLASMQLHETALSNVAAGLELAGTRLTAQELADRLPQMSPEAPRRELSSEARDVEIEFADRNPVEFKLQDGKLHAAWNIRELMVRGRATRDFKIHVYYTPTTDGLVARFDHSAGPYLEGSLRNAERMRLQAILGKVFPEDAQLTVGERYASDPRFEGLMITQLVIDDGWLGIAIGPDHPERTAQLDRYQPRY